MPAEPKALQTPLAATWPFAEKPRDADAPNISGACRSLEEVDILRQIPGEGIAILRNLPKLKSLVVSKVTQVDTGGEHGAGDQTPAAVEKASRFQILTQ